MSPTESAKIVKAERTLGPWGAGLAGYNSAGRLMLVIPIKTSRPVEWARKGVSRADLLRLQKSQSGS